MKLSTKLLLSYFTVACLVLLIGVASLFLNEHIKNDLIQENRHSIEELQRLSNLRFHLQNSLIFTRNFLFEKSRERSSPTIQVQLQSRRAEQAARNSLTRFHQYLESIDMSDSTYHMPEFTNEQVYEEVNQFSDTLSQSFDIYESLLLDLFDLETETGLGDEIFNLTIEPYFRTTLLPILDRYQTQHSAAIELKIQSLESRVQRNTRIIIFITLVAFFFSIALAYLIYNSIARPLRYLTRATEKIGSGNLSQRIHIGTNDELEQLGESFNRMAENLNKSMVSREYVNNIIQSMGDMLVVTDSDFVIRLVNRSVTDTLGYRAEELSGATFWRLFPEDRIASFEQIIDQKPTRHSMESRFLSADGKEIPVLISCTRLEPSEQMGAGEIVFVAGNITIQKEAEEKISRSLKEKEVLLSEIHHRVKNNLAVISGLLEMQLWTLSENDVNISPLQESQLRIQSIALVHELLYQSDNFSEIQLEQYIHKLLKAIQKTHKNDEKAIEIRTDLENVSLTIQKAIPASLILNELVVNAYKHAFDGRSGGTISVSLSQEEDTVQLIVEDDGVGLPTGFDPLSQKSLGMTLIKTLIRQIGASFTLNESEKTSTGTRCVIRFTNS